MDKGQDSGQDPGQDPGQEEQQVVYQCPQCNNYLFKTREGAYKHRQRYGHRVVGIDANTGEIIEEIGKGRPGPKSPLTLAAKKPAISAKGDEHIKEHYKGYSKDGERYLFIMSPDGTIRDFRLEQPLMWPIYELMRKGDYKGDFPQFIADAVETLFANAGYELTLTPKSQSAMYDEVIRLLKEGKLELAYEGQEMRLGVKEDGNKAQRAEGPTSPGGEGTTKLELSQQGGEEELSEPQ